MIETATLRVLGPVLPAHERILTPEALAFVAGLAARFDGRRRELLELREARLEAGDRPHFLPETAWIREGDWRVAAAPMDLVDRRVEITGPAERKMILNALNSGAKVFMADLEDALSPTWRNVLEAQLDLCEAVAGTLRLETPTKTYELADETATLVVRPRGWHLEERHVQLDGRPVSASLFDFGLYFFHNARPLLGRGSGPYFYLPKLESHLEARLWNDVFLHAQEELGLPPGSIRATVLIETLPAAFEMEEILYELRQHAAGLNAGRWDYIFSLIKTFHRDPAFVLPDRASVTMAVPFMQSYAELLVRTCHRRGAHAIGGMAAFIPSRQDAQVNARAFAKVEEDKRREAAMGFDGTWVAHPDLVPVALACFDEVLGEKPHQKDVARLDVKPDAHRLLDTRMPGSGVTLFGVRTNVSVALRYLAAWLEGRGAVAIDHLMEDAATAEIARAQLWQWVAHAALLDDGRPVTRELFKPILADELRALGPGYNPAAALLERLVLAPKFERFLTVAAYEAVSEREVVSQ